MGAWIFLDALASLDFKLPVSQSVSQSVIDVFQIFSKSSNTSDKVKQVTLNTHVTSNTSSTRNAFYVNDA